MEEIKLYEELLRMKQAGQPGVLITVVDSQGSTPRKAGAKMLVRDDQSTVGTVGGGAVELRALDAARQVLATGQPTNVACELNEAHGMTCGGRLTMFLEPLTVIPRLLVVGKGHIGRALKDLGTRAGFAVTLMEPPAEEEGSPSLTQDLTAALADRTGYVVVACPTHQQDFAAVRAALDSPARWVGMVGSRRKRRSLDQYLAEQGIPDTAIATVASPVGLDIAAETPAEIAVSILAQLVQDYRSHEK